MSSPIINKNKTKTPLTITTYSKTCCTREKKTVYIAPLKWPYLWINWHITCQADERYECYDYWQITPSATHQETERGKLTNAPPYAPTAFRFGWVTVIVLGSFRIHFHHQCGLSRMLCLQRKGALEMRGYQSIFRRRIAAMLMPNWSCDQQIIPKIGIGLHCSSSRHRRMKITFRHS